MSKHYVILSFLLLNKKNLKGKELNSKRESHYSAFLLPAPMVPLSLMSYPSLSNPVYYYSHFNSLPTVLIKIAESLILNYQIKNNIGWKSLKPVLTILNPLEHSMYK